MTMLLRRGALAIACLTAVGVFVAATPAMGADKPGKPTKPTGPPKPTPTNPGDPFGGEAFVLFGKCKPAYRCGDVGSPGGDL